MRTSGQRTSSVNGKIVLTKNCCIYLVYSDTTFIDAIRFGEQETHLSFGRYPKGVGSFIERMPLFAAENLSGVVDIQNNSQEIPEDIRLYQNFPNPFNPMTTIRYYLRATSQVTLKVYNALDQDIRILVDQKRASGEKLVIWDGKNSAGVEASSGVYIYRLHAEDHEKQLKMVLYR